MSRTDRAEAEAHQSLLLFQIAGRQFGTDLDRVEHVLNAQPVTPTPRPPAYVEGILEHGGRYLAVASLRKRLGVPGTGPDHPAILVLRGIGPDQAMGLVVDQVLRVVQVPPEGVVAPPPRVFGIRAEFIRGIGNAGGRPLVWLDLEKLLTGTDPITLVV